MNKRVILIVMGMLISSPALASVGLGFHGSWSFPGSGFSGVKGVSPGFGGEILAGIAQSDSFQLGAFYDRNEYYYDSGATGWSYFWGGIVRIELQQLAGVFLDFKVGGTASNNGVVDSEGALGFGVGMGYVMKLGSLVSLKPKISYRSLPFKSGASTIGQSIVDASFLLAFLF